MADEFRLHTVQLNAKSLTQNFGMAGSEDYRTHPSDRGVDNPATVFAAMRDKDGFKEFDPKLLKGTIYSLKNRSIITRWIRDVCVAFNLKSTTLCLAVQLTDRFILGNLEQLPLNHCQLSAIAAVWIAAKFEELDAMLPSLKGLVDVCDGAYRAEQIIDMEESVLGFVRWRVPHTTVNNYLYFYLHMMTDLKYTLDVPKGPTPPDDRLTVKLLRPPGATDVVPRASLRAVTVVIPFSTPLVQNLPLFCSSLGVTSVKGALEVYRVLGDDVTFARRLDANLSPQQLGLGVGDSLFLAATVSACVFTEREHVVLMRPLNTLLLHLCETLLQQTLLSPEFLKVNPHLTAMAVLVLTRAILSSNPELLQPWSNHLCRSLNISRSNTASLCDVLSEKYRHATETDPSAFAQPIVPVPSDMHDRILLAFGRQ